MKNFEQYESKKTDSESDIVIYGLKKYLSLACKGNISALNFLFCRKADILYIDDYGQTLRDNRNLFLSHKVIDCILGYTMSQIHRMRNGSGRSDNRKDLIDKYGWDTKFAYHAVLITDIGVELLKSGTYHVYRPDMEQRKLKGIRTGQYTYEQTMELIQQNLTVIKTLEPISRLPKDVDKDAINKLNVELLTKYFKENT